MFRRDYHAEPERVEDGPGTSFAEGHGALAGAPLARWMIPFIAVAVVAQLSAAMPPDLRSPSAFAASCVVFVAVLIAALLLPWRRLPVGAQLLVPLGYLASLLLLMISQDTASSGMRALVLLPIMWVALYHRPVEGLVVTVCAIGVLTAVALIDEGPIGVIARRAVLWGAMGVLIVLSVHNLRRWLGAAIAERNEALRHAEVLSAAAEELNASLDPAQVLAVATRLAAEVASPPGVAARRASYLEIDGESVHVAGSFDETGESRAYAWSVSEHPLLREVIRTGSAKCGELDPDEVGPSLAAAIQATGIRDSALVPIYVDGALHGVLALASRGEPIGPQQLSRCVAIGHLLQPALANALAHECSKQAAMTDPLTSLANRRGLDELFSARHGRRAFGVLSLDVDGLKAVNDRYGHAVGDELIVRVSEAAQLSLRDGDVLARIGGDEFAAVVFDGDEHALRQIAERVLDAAHDAGSDSLRPHVSIGGACADADSAVTLGDVLRRADSAMYAAKRAGGATYAAAEELETYAA